MATEKITISELELADEVLADMVIAVDGSTDTKAITLGQIKDWIDIEGYVLQKLPRGIVFPFGGSTAPSGFLLCDGSAISRTTYADLFQVIGTTYGSGDGATTFNLPNLIDKFVQGSNSVGVVKAAGIPDHIHLTGNNGNNAGFFVATGKKTSVTFNQAVTSAGTSGQTSWNGNNSGGTFTSKPDTISGNSITSASKTATTNNGETDGVYGKSTTVQPPALTMLYCIKY